MSFFSTYNVDDVNEEQQLVKRYFENQLQWIDDLFIEKSSILCSNASIVACRMKLEPLILS